MTFSPSDAAFEGFRVVRRNPMVLVFWSLVYLVAGVAQLLALQDARPALERLREATEALQQSGRSGAPDIQGFMDAVNGLNLAQWEAMPVMLVISVMLSAAVCRAVLRPDARAFGFLRIGMDEVRLFAVLLVLGLIFGFGLGIAVLIASLVTAAAIATLGPLGGLVAAIVFIGLFCLSVWLVVRFSLAAAVVIGTGRFALFDSFALTRGRFWSLLGMGLLAAVLTIVVSLLGGVVVMPVTAAAGLDDPSRLTETINLANPWVWVITVLQAVLKALTVGVFAAPFAAAYRDLRGV